MLFIEKTQKKFLYHIAIENTTITNKRVNWKVIKIPQLLDGA